MRGNKHTFLGVNIDIKDNTIHVDMFEKLEGDASKSVTSTVTKKLFEVREDYEKLSDKKGELFHLVVVKLLFIIKRSRPHLETAVIFLTKRVSNIDIDDWEKLKRILGFVHCTPKEKNMFWRNKPRQDINMGE